MNRQSPPVRLVFFPDVPGNGRGKIDASIPSFPRFLLKLSKPGLGLDLWCAERTPGRVRGIAAYQ